MISKIEYEIWEIYNDILTQNNLISKVKTNYFKKLLIDNVIKSLGIVKCINSTIELICNLESDKVKEKELINSVLSFKRKFNISNNELLDIINSSEFENMFKVSCIYQEKINEKFIEFSYMMIEFGIATIKIDSSALKDNLEIILTNVMDNVPFVSEIKSSIELIRDLAKIVNNLDKDIKYKDEIILLDAELAIIEQKNYILNKTYEFMSSFKYLHKF